MSASNNTQPVENQPAVPPLCANGCGFFANVGSSGMCSKCFREVAKKELENQQAVKAVASALAAPQPQAEPQEAAEARPAAAPAPSPEAGPSSAPEAAGTSDSAPAAAAPQAPEPCPTRCFTCRKKTGLTGFKCRCGHNFCGSHRYAEAHECTFDYKTVGRQQLASSNPLVQASKVQRF